MMKGLLIASAVLAMAGTAQADQWGSVPMLAIGGAAIDANSIILKDGHATFWWLKVFEKPLVLPNGKTVEYILERDDMDCERQTSAVLLVVGYNKSEKVLSTDGPDGTSQSVIPESNGSYMFKIACQGDRTGWNDLPGGVSGAVQFLGNFQENWKQRKK